MATDDISVGGIRIVIGADTSDLEAGVQRSTRSLRDFSTAAGPLERQIDSIKNTADSAGSAFDAYSKKVESALKTTQASVRDIVSALEPKGKIGELLEITKNPFKGIETPILSMRGLEDFKNNLNALGLESGKVTGLLQRLSDGSFVQVQNQSQDASVGVGHLTVAVSVLGEEAQSTAKLAGGLANVLPTLFSGGGIVAAAALAMKTLKDYGDSLVELGLNARRAMMTLDEFQTTQKAFSIAGNLSMKTFASDANDVAKNLNDANREENDLSKLLDKNNIKFKEGEKVVLGTRDAILLMVDMLQRARNEQDRIKIGEAFGVSKEFVEAARRGGDSIREIIRDTSLVGESIDYNMVEKAERFSDNWRRYSALALTYVKSFVTDAGDAIDALNKEDGAASRFASYMADRLRYIMAGLNFVGHYRSGDFAGQFRVATTEVELQNEALKQNAEAIKRIEELTGKSEKGLVGPPIPKGPPIEFPEKDDKENEALRKALERRVDQVRQSFEAEDMAQVIHLERQNKILKEGLDKNVLTQTQYDDLMTQGEEKHRKKMEELVFSRLEESTASETEILAKKYEKQIELLNTFEYNRTISTQRAEEDRRKIRERYALDTLQAQVTSADKLASIADASMAAINDIMSDGSKKGFNIMKALSIATAVVHGFSASIAAYRAGIEFGAMIGNPMVGQALGVAFAGIAAAGTAATIAKIAGVGPNSTGAGAGGGVPSSGSASPSGARAGGETPPLAGQVLTVRGLSGKGLFSTEMVRDLAKQLLQYQRDGGRVVLA